MAKAGTILLITKENRAHGVHEATSDTQRLVLCTVKTVRQSEYYQAENIGYRPEIQFDLTLAADYHGESTLLYEKKEYRVIRTYEKPAGGLEIIAERSDVNGEDTVSASGAGDGDA